MGRVETKLTTCMITQQTNTDYFPFWTEDEQEAIDKANASAIASVIHNRLTRSGFAVSELHCIIHDRDSQNIWSDTKHDYVTELKVTHFHCVVKFTQGKGGTLTAIGNALGMERQYIEKPKAGRYGYDNMLSYLIHIKYPDKYQYKPSDVVSLDSSGSVTDSYTTIYSQRRNHWIAGIGKRKKETAKEQVDDLIERILSGQVTKSQVLLTQELFDVYSRNKAKCSEAFDSFAERKIARTIKAMDDGEYKLSVIFVTGRAGSGKSRFTDNLAMKVQADAKERTGEDWSICSVASSNPFDEYNGEEILIMDDLRGIALTASDWLKLLDPERIGIGAARYRNKSVACRTVIINSEKDVFDFFYYCKGLGGQGADKSEAMDQFLRRILARVDIQYYADCCQRIAETGFSQRVSPYNVDKPDKEYSWDCMTVNYDFNKDRTFYSLPDAVEVVSCAIADNNTGAITEQPDLTRALTDDELHLKFFRLLLSTYDKRGNIYHPFRYEPYINGKQHGEYRPTVDGFDEWKNGVHPTHLFTTEPLPDEETTKKIHEEILDIYRRLLEIATDVEADRMAYADAEADKAWESRCASMADEYIERNKNN